MATSYAWLLALVLGAAADDAAPPRGGYEYGLLTIPQGGEAEVNSFVDEVMLPRNAVAVLTGKGAKRRALLEELTEDGVLKHVFSFGAQPGSGPLVLTVYWPGQGPKFPYEGKWTRKALRAWLLEVGYPLINFVEGPFPWPKYLTETEFGTVLITAPSGGIANELIDALVPWVEKYRTKLKFTTFIKAPDTQRLCDMAGVLSNDELLLMENPTEQHLRGPSHVPAAAKYRLETLTPARIQEFFESYEAGKLHRYFKSDLPPDSTPLQEAIGRPTELTAWNFEKTVSNPGLAVLVAFYSADCEGCKDFEIIYDEVAKKAQELAANGHPFMKKLLVARLNQTSHEHSEEIQGCPWQRFWPRGQQKRPVDVFKTSVDGILAYLEAKGDADRGDEL